jgi:hypothetical protein
MLGTTLNEGVKRVSKPALAYELERSTRHPGTHVDFLRTMSDFGSERLTELKLGRWARSVCGRAVQ